MGLGLGLRLLSQLGLGPVRTALHPYYFTREYNVHTCTGTRAWICQNQTNSLTMKT